jgi:hypothetical protein
MDKPNKNFLFILSLLTLAAGIYLYRPYGLYFLADDFIHIPESINNLVEQRNSLRPMGNISLHIDYLISHTSAKGYHVTNLLLHALNTFFVFLLCRAFLKRYDRDTDAWLPIMVAIVFFIYPFHSEAVFWILGRSGSLGTLFFLPALILYLHKEKSIFYFIGSLLCFELALLSYESSWIFPLLTLLIAFFDAKNKSINKKVQALQVTLVWFVFICHLFLRAKLTGQLFNSYDTGSLLHINLKSLSLNGFRLLARTLLPPFVNAQWLMVSLFTALMFIVALVVKFYRHDLPKRLFLVLSYCWLLSYIPYLSLGVDTHGVEGERYLYLPSVFFCLWLMYVLYRIINKQWQTCFTVVFIAISIFYLHQSRSYYIKAGEITRTTINEIGKLDNKETILVENLPQNNKGAVVFRLGFEDAIKWLHPNNNAAIKVVSIDDSDKHVKQAKLGFAVKFDTSANQKEAVFIFTDSSLTIKR